MAGNWRGGNKKKNNCRASLGKEVSRKTEGGKDWKQGSQTNWGNGERWGQRRGRKESGRGESKVLRNSVVLGNGVWAGGC